MDTETSSIARSAVRAKALFFISSDPRKDHRAAEAMRIAAGVSGWQAADVAIYLDHAFMDLLAEVGDHLEADSATKQIPALLKAGVRFLYPRAHRAVFEANWPGDARAWQGVDDRQLAFEIAECQHFLKF